jgi:hypothetical protein
LTSSLCAVWKGHDVVNSHDVTSKFMAWALQKVLLQLLKDSSQIPCRAAHSFHEVTFIVQVLLRGHTVEVMLPLTQYRWPGAMMMVYLCAAFASVMLMALACGASLPESQAASTGSAQHATKPLAPLVAELQGSTAALRGHPGGGLVWVLGRNLGGACVQLTQVGPKHQGTTTVTAGAGASATNLRQKSLHQCTATFTLDNALAACCDLLAKVANDC